LHRLINTPLLRARDDDERITRTLFPRWRTMMHPVVTFSSPYFFTPKYLALPSRPFLTEPVPFLCAHSMTAVRGLASATRWCGAMRSVAVESLEDNAAYIVRRRVSARRRGVATGAPNGRGVSGGSLVMIGRLGVKTLN
jgi:hypothetical protein